MRKIIACIATYATLNPYLVSADQINTDRYTKAWDQLWTQEYPLPEIFLTGKNKCFNIDSSENLIDPGPYPLDFNIPFSKSNTSLLRGVCLLNSNQPHLASQQFVEASAQLKIGFEWMQLFNEKEKEKFQNRIDVENSKAQQARSIKDIFDALSQVSTTLGRRNSQEASIVRFGFGLISQKQGDIIRNRNIAIQEIEKELRDFNLENNLKSQSTIRVPIVPLGGFSRLLVKLSSGCTGSFIGPKTLLTNYHCVKPGQMYAYRTVPSAVERYTIISVNTPFEGIYNDNSKQHQENDWAILTIAEERSDKDNYFKIAPATPKNLKSVMVAGYSADFNAGRIITGDFNCPVSKYSASFIDYICSTTGGSSGSPVFSITNQNMIIGLNARSSNRLSDGTYARENAASLNNRKNAFAILTEKFSEQVYNFSPESRPTQRQITLDIANYLSGFEYNIVPKSRNKILTSNPDLGE